MPRLSPRRARDLSPGTLPCRASVSTRVIMKRVNWVTFNPSSSFCGTHLSVSLFVYKEWNLLPTSQVCFGETPM